MYNSANFAGPSKGALHTQLVIMLKHCCFSLFFIKNEYYSVQARLIFLFSKEQRPECFFRTLGGQIIYIIYNQTPHPANQMVVPKINQEINEPSYEMVGVKITNKLIKSEWNALQLIIFKVNHTRKNFFARQEMKEI